MSTSSQSEITVRDLMTRAVHTLSPMQSLPLAESMMGLFHIRHIPVVDDERRVVGIVTHRDLLAAKISALAPLTDDDRAELQLSVPVERIMRTNVWTITPDTLAINATRIMREHRLGCLPVVDSKTGKLVGILTEADLLALVTDSLTLEHPHHQRHHQYVPERPTIASVMTHVPVTISRDTSVADARSLMASHKVRHLPVVDNGKAVSMVSDRDLSVVEVIFRDAKSTAAAAHVVNMLGSTRIQRVRLDERLDVVLRQMFSERLDAVLVVNPSERLVGIFSAMNACRILAEKVRTSVPHRPLAALHTNKERVL